MSTTTDDYPVATFNNKLGVDVDIYDVFNDTNPSNLNGPFTYTNIGTVHGTSPVNVKTKREGSQLVAMLTGNNDTFKSFYWQLPVGVYGVDDFDTVHNYDITTAGRTSMEDAFTFIKYVQANASGKTAQDFGTVLASYDDDTINTWFKSSGSFSNVTIDSWQAVLNWQAQFTSPWQGTYYLYGTPSGNASTTGNLALIATLSIQSTSSNNSATVIMANSNNQSTKVVMVGMNKIQEEKQGTGGLAVDLTAAWMNISQTSGSGTATTVNYAIGAAFSGTINGIQVAGNLNKLTIPDPSDTSTTAPIQNDANKFSFDQITTLLSTIGSLGMLYFMYVGHRFAKQQAQKQAEKDAKDGEDAKKKAADIEKQDKADTTPKLKTENDKSPDLRVKAETSSQGMAESDSNQTLLENLKKGESAYTDCLKKGPPSNDTELVAKDYKGTETLLKTTTNSRASTSDRGLARQNAQRNLNEATTKVTNYETQYSAKLSSNEKAAAEAARKTGEAQKAQEEQAEKAEAARKAENEKSSRDTTDTRSATDHPEEGRSGAKVHPEGGL